MRYVFFLFIFCSLVGHQAHATTPIAPPICDIEGWLLATSSASRSGVYGTIEIIYAKNANYDHDCSKLVGKTYDNVLFDRLSLDLNETHLPHNFAASMWNYNSDQPTLYNATTTKSVFYIDDNNEIPSQNFFTRLIRTLFELILHL